MKTEKEEDEKRMKRREAVWRTTEAEKWKNTSSDWSGDSARRTEEEGKQEDAREMTQAAGGENREGKLLFGC